MTPFRKKLTLIFFPFLVVAIATIIGYTFINWLVVTELQLFTVSSKVAGIIIPIIIPWVPLLIWQRRRLKLLNLANARGRDPLSGLLCLNWMTIAVPLMLAQFYMVTATGKLTRLTYISEINRFPQTKYYSVKHYYCNKNMVHVKTTFTISGRGNTNFDMDIYAAVPVFDFVYPDTTIITRLRNGLNPKALIILNGKLASMKQLKKLPADSIKRMKWINPSVVMPMYGDTGKFGALAVITQGYKTVGLGPPDKIFPVMWLGIKYRKTIKNSLSQAEKDINFKMFVKETGLMFMNMHLDKFAYLEQITSDDEVDHLIEAVRSKDDVVDGQPIILSPVFEPFEKRNGDKLLWMFVSFTTGSLILLAIISLMKFEVPIQKRAAISWATPYIERLNNGETVQFRQKAKSMTGKVEPGQLVTVEPVGERMLEAGDIVLCKVKSSQYLHIIIAVNGKRYQIGNNIGKVNGWINRGSIYGVCTSVED